MSHPNCTAVNDTSTDCQCYLERLCKSVTADPDIGGIGVFMLVLRSCSPVQVIVAFVATAFLTLVFSILAIWIDNRNRRIDIPEQTAEQTHSIQKFKVYRGILEKLVLGLSDQQLITGLAILSIGLWRLPPSHGFISFYHFSLLQDLAWFSSNTHQLAVIVLKTYFREHRTLRILRGTGMLILGLMLLVVTGFTSIVPQTDIFACPAQCVIVDFSYSQFRGAPIAFMLLNMLFLIWVIALR